MTATEVGKASPWLEGLWRARLVVDVLGCLLLAGVLAFQIVTYRRRVPPRTRFPVLLSFFKIFPRYPSAS
jgi:hypothetical protein